MIDIHAITVCVNYAHLFKYCVGNKKFFKRCIIVTVEDDIDTINLCKENNLEYIFSKTLYTRKFAKGCAINEAIDYIGYDKEWYLHIDADVLLPTNFNDTFEYNEETDNYNIIGTKRLKRTGVEKYFKQDLSLEHPALYLYTMGRVNVDEEEDFEMFIPQQYFDLTDNIIQRHKGYGYFQLFHLPSLLKVYPDLRYVYPNLSKNAGHDDFIFQKMFYQTVSLNTYCIHLSPEEQNWDGI